jgi:tetratricopeptide (TPR) repeat protein
MKQDVDSGAELRKFIPIGYGDFEVNRTFIPAFIRGATYYDLTAATISGFGFEDLVRRFQNEFRPAEKSEGARGGPGTAASWTERQPVMDVYNRALRSLSNGDYDGALNGLDQALEIDSTMAPAYYNRGLTHYLKGDDDLAINDFSRAVRLGFDDVLLFRNRANAYSRKGDVARALADYAQAIALEPGNPLAYLNRGEVYENTLQRDLAIADYKTVLGLVCEPRWHDTARERLIAMGVAV